MLSSLLLLALAAADTTSPRADSVAVTAVAVDTAGAAGPRLAPSRFVSSEASSEVSSEVSSEGASLAPTAYLLPSTDTVRPRRPRAVEYSDWYARRLEVHRVASYTMLPLFAGEYVLGQRLLSTSPQPNWVRPSHIGVAYGLAALFTVNTVTGAWNLWDARHDESGRTRRVVHTALMLASEAGFAYTGSIAEQARGSLDGAHRHRNAALASMGLSVAGTGMMWFWKD